MVVSKLPDTATHPAVPMTHRISLSGSRRNRATSCRPTWQILIPPPPTRCAYGHAGHALGRSGARRPRHAR
eukprot:14265627-Alexandrium_andersonii.AAC.1